MTWFAGYASSLPTVLPRRSCFTSAGMVRKCRISWPVIQTGMRRTDSTRRSYPATQNARAAKGTSATTNCMLSSNSICRDGRARLWVVLDCCHSGTGVRGATKVRKLARPNLAPANSVGSIFPKKLAAGCVVLSACRATEVEPEYQDEGGHFGLLTRFLVQLLLQRPTISNVSYKTLQEAIVAQYRGDPTLVQPPTPQLEGSREILDQVVLGAGEAMDRAPCWEVVPAGRDLGQAMLLAGQLHGITAGSLYELAASPDAFTRGTNDQGPAENRPQSDWIRIEKVQGITSMGRVFHWTDEQQTETVNVLLPRDFRRGVAMERYHEPGALGIRVRVVRATDAQQDSPSLTPGEAPDVVQRALQNAQRPEEMDWITWTDDEMPCDVLLRIDGSHAALFPATGLNEGGQTFSARGSATLASLRGGWGPIDLRSPIRRSPNCRGTSVASRGSGTCCVWPPSRRPAILQTSQSPWNS